MPEPTDQNESVDRGNQRSEEKDQSRNVRSGARIRQQLPVIAAALAGILIGIWLAVFLLPNTGLFQSSALGRYIDERSLIAAKAASEGVRTDVAQQLAAIETQKQIIEESSDSPIMTVSEVVEQYHTSVVTIVTVIPDPEFLGEERNFIGTGFILNREGMIATNQHVIGGADTISVILSNGQEFLAKEINSDRDADLAIIQIEDQAVLPGIVTLGDSNDVTVGEQVVAIGSPVSRNFAGTVTSGIISGKDRDVYIGDQVISYLQTDAAINEGNSGGPLFNARGEVIGINTAKMSDDIQGIGFAIPINVLKEKLTILSRTPLYTGFTAKDLNPEALTALNISNGVVVIAVDEGSPADLAGLKEQDIILQFDGVTIRKTSQMNGIRERYEPGQTITMQVRRGNETLTLELKLSEGP